MAVVFARKPARKSFFCQIPSHRIQATSPPHPRQQCINPPINLFTIQFSMMFVCHIPSQSRHNIMKNRLFQRPKSALFTPSNITQSDPKLQDASNAHHISTSALTIFPFSYKTSTIDPCPHKHLASENQLIPTPHLPVEATISPEWHGTWPTKHQRFHGYPTMESSNFMPDHNSLKCGFPSRGTM